MNNDNCDKLKDGPPKDRPLSYSEMEAEIERLRAVLERLKALVDKQAEDERLWTPTASEEYLQQELRKLHTLIEEE